MSPAIHPLAEEDEFSSVWRALADPTRRRMLDMLRERPRTTSELADAFPQSRFAVMKHLDTLAGAGLVVARRRGRERWNHLNAVPLRQIYERWVRPYEAAWASSLIGIRTLAERPDPPLPSTPETDPVSPQTSASARAIDETGIARVEMEIPIAAGPDRVWRAMVDDVAAWWPADFLASGAGARMRFDATVGGRLLEERPDGAGVLWYTVIAVEPGRSVDLVGHLTPSYGGPATTMLRLALRAEGPRTVLELSDARYGRVSGKDDASLEQGWRLLFEGGLKTYVESAPERA